MSYDRPVGAKVLDFQRARQFEEVVGQFLPEHRISRLNHTDELDFWVPGWYLEVKEKWQPITARWPMPAGTVEPDSFIIDELTIRRALEKDPLRTYFLLRDVPKDRMFLVRFDELMAANHTRVDRMTGKNQHRKGKWVIDTSYLRVLPDLTELTPTILQDQLDMSWKQSACLTAGKEVPLA